MTTALTNIPSPKINNCELTFLESQPIDYSLALKQHHNYSNTLKKYGINVIQLDISKDLPDSVFLEDTAIVLDEIAILCSMGTKSRNQEVTNIRPEIAKYRKISEIKHPATIEGGDVLKIGKTLHVGLSTRTNMSGIDALKKIVSPFDYQVIPLEVKKCLHLKTAMTALDNSTLLVNSHWLGLKQLKNFKIISIDPDEQFAANILSVNGHIITQESFPKTAEILNSNGFDVSMVDISEFAKAEAGLTCMSILF